MNATSLWLMIVGMGVYQGLNPSMGWLHGVSRGLERRSAAAVLRGTAAFAAGHYLAMLVVLLPAALVFALTPADPMALLPWLGGAMIGFALFKLLRPSHPRFLVRIPPGRPARWSFAMALTHCGSPMMMLGPLISLLMAIELGRLAQSGFVPRLGSFAAAALIVPGTMAASLLLTASAVAIAVYRHLGLRSLTRYWVNLDFGWIFVFFAMGAMALLMGESGTMTSPSAHEFHAGA